jgi:hypothetical protein
VRTPLLKRRRRHSDLIIDFREFDEAWMKLGRGKISLWMERRSGQSGRKRCEFLF